MEQYKEEYNKLLKRANNGAKYLAEHEEEIDKFLPELVKIEDRLSEIIVLYDLKDTNTIINGFK